jgi:hypothetical protein
LISAAQRVLFRTVCGFACYNRWNLAWAGENDLKPRWILMGVLSLAGAAVCFAQDQPPDVQPADPAVDAVPSTPPHTPLLKRLFSVQALTATVPGAVLQQVHDWPNEWGTKRSGFEKRIGSLYGQFVIGVLIEDGVKAIHHEDTWYRRLGHGNFFQRTGHVITDTVTARRPDGSRTVALSMPANAYGSWAIATLWSPREFRNAGSIFEWGTAGVGVSAGTNLVREFWPDVKSIFRKKK